MGLKQLPRELTAFELEAFFTFTAAERQVIEDRRGSGLQLGLALQIGFLRMSGRVLDAVRIVPAVFWNTIYMEAVLEQLRKDGYPVNEEDKARLSPLIHEHINTQGRHSFMMSEAVAKGELRPLRNPPDDPD